MKKRYAWLVFILLSGAIVKGELSAIPTEHFWVTDGPVKHISPLNGILYAGGTFNYVGKRTGAPVALDLTNGGIIDEFPQVRGDIFAIAADGSGGWFLGGSFTNVGGVARTNLAHIKGDLTLDSTDFPQPTGPVLALAMNSSNLMVGGKFVLTVGTQTATNVALIDLETGQARDWSPPPIGSVTALAEYKGLFYAAFRNRIEIFDPATQTQRLLPQQFGAFFLSANPIVVMRRQGQMLYVGGDFRDINSVAHGPLAAIDLESETLTGWNPLLSSSSAPSVYALAVDSERVYVGNSAISAYDANTAALQWTAELKRNFSGATNWALALRGGMLLAGGDFLSVNGQVHERLVALDRVSGAVQPWQCHANGRVNAISAEAEMPIAAGSFTSAGGLARSNLAAFDMRTGAANDWKPAVDQGVTQVVATDDAIFIGGIFRVVNSETRNFLAAVDPVSGNVLSLDAQLPAALGSLYIGITGLAQNGDAMIFTGYFTNLFGTTDQFIASFDRHTFQRNSSFRPTFDRGISSLIVRSNIAYVAGLFRKANGLARTNLAALDATTGNVLSWDAQVQPQYVETLGVSSMSVANSRLYICGSFLKVAGQLRSQNAAIDLSSASLTPWTMTLPAAFFGKLYASQSAVFLNYAPSGSGLLLEAFDSETGERLPWNPNFGSLISDFLETPTALIAAGDAGITVFEKSPSFNAITTENPPKMEINAFEGDKFAVDASSDLRNWTEIVATNSDFKVFIGSPLNTGENRFYRLRSIAP